MSLFSKELSERIDRWIKTVSGGKSHIALEQEIKLVKAYHSDLDPIAAQDALQELLAYNANNLAAIVLDVFYNTRAARALDPVDLLQEATKVFIKKLGTFQLGRGVRLITYYTRDVRTAIQRYVINHALNVRQGSVYLQGLAAQISQVRRKVQQDEVELTHSQLAEQIGVSDSTISMVAEFTGVVVVSLSSFKGPLVKLGDRDSRGLGRLYQLFESKLQALSPEQFELIFSCLRESEDIPSSILMKIKGR